MTVEHEYRHKCYYFQRKNAERRGISWQLTYIQWIRIWIRSGHWKERGRNRGNYCMARFGDKGPYSKLNVKICTVNENISNALVGNKFGRYNRGERNGRAKITEKDVKKIRKSEGCIVII